MRHDMLGESGCKHHDPKYGAILVRTCKTTYYLLTKGYGLGLVFRV